MALAAFYQKIVGGEFGRSSTDDDWVELEVDGHRTIAFQEAKDYKAPGWPDGSPQQAHLDFDVPDLDVGEAAVLEIGAVKADVQPQPNSWRVFLDPAGHPFCLVHRPAS
jgi:hypothetical protein